MKMKYDESDNALIRASRAVTDRVTDFVGEALSKSFSSMYHSYWLIADPQLSARTLASIHTAHSVISSVGFSLQAASFQRQRCRRC